MSNPLIADSSVVYQIETTQAQHHYFTVELTLMVSTKADWQLRLPAWLPGSYMIRDFAKHIVTFSAASETGALDYIRSDKSTWQLPPCEGEVTIRYSVYAHDLSVRSAWLDSEFGFFNPSSLCLEVVGGHQHQHQINITPAPYAAWQLATGMPAVNIDSRGFGVYNAQSYAELIDYPMLMGSLTRIHFTAEGVPHELVLVGAHFADEQRLSADLQAICSAQINSWQHVPFAHYKFLTIVVADGFGGLEHRNSTALLCSRHTLEPYLHGNNTELSDEYLTFLSLCSHEYFHSWNIKQLRPACFHPYQLQQEQYTEQLWFYEGITSYLDDYFLHQSGVMAAPQYLARLGQTISRALRGKGPSRQSVLESSTLAWTTFYQQNENAQNAIASYYSKGAVIALLLDLATRLATEQQANLMSIMRLVDTRHRLHGTEHHQLLQAIAAVTNEALAQQVNTWLASTESLPIDVLLQQFGVELSPATPDPFSLQPGLTSSAPSKVSLGAALLDKGEFVQIARIFEDSAAAVAGLAVHDKLVAIDGLQATRNNLLRAYQRYQPGMAVTVHLLRDDRLLSKQLVWQAPKADGYQLQLTNRALSAGWLT